MAGLPPSPDAPKPNPPFPQHPAGPTGPSQLPLGPQPRRSIIRRGYIRPVDYAMFACMGVTAVSSASPLLGSFLLC